MLGPGAPRQHGGSPPPGAIDFSAPSNPLGPPRRLRELVSECAASRVYESYPSTKLYSELRSSISEFTELSEDSLVIANGSAELLSALPLALRARRLIVVEPNFGDHLILSQSLGLPLTRLPMKPEGPAFKLDLEELARAALRSERPAVILMSRPNNPTGAMVSQGQVDELLSRLPKDVYLVVDEAFIDLSPGGRSLGEREDLILLRSLTKDFSTPGLRLGVAATLNRRALIAISGYMQAWPVDSITACAMSRYLSEREAKSYILEGREVVARELPRMTQELRRLGLLAFESKAPFILIRHEKPNPEFASALLKRGVYIRDASSFYSLGPNYSRVSVRQRGQNDLLLRAVGEVMLGL